ncbi:MAG TPA: ATP-binding cassette domain-containing protein [Jatrophihabitantaceae bacterium]
MTTTAKFQAGLSVRCEALHHAYVANGTANVALQRIDLTVHAGENVAILGVSGSGKSTLVTLVAGLQRPTSGHLYIGADDVALMNERELLQLRGQRVGVVLQNPARNLLPYGTGLDNVTFAQRSTRGYRRQQLPKPRQLLEDLGLAHLARQRVNKMSGGEQQRLAVAVSVAAAPGLVIADEPTSQVDRASRDQVVELLLRVGHNYGLTLLVVTHDPHVAGALGRTITIHDGLAHDRGQTLEQFTNVNPDGSIPLPHDLAQRFAPGTRTRIIRKARGIELVPDDEP